MPMWFSVHIVSAYQRADLASSEIIVEESIYLLSGVDRHEIETKANAIISSDINNNVSYFYDKPSKTIASKVRKIVQISNKELGNERPPTDLSELSFEIYCFKNRKNMEDYMSNRSIDAEFWKKNIDI